MNDVTIQGEMTVDQLVAQVAKIQEVMSKVMTDGEHYGVIPGTKKKSLLKPGAEKLNLVFKLVPEFQKTIIDLPNGHREVQVQADIFTMGTHVLVGQGFGSCSTMEKKYRYRESDAAVEVGPVPKEYWDVPKEDKDAFQRRQAVLREIYGEGKYKTKKVDGQWVVLLTEGDDAKVENPDIAETYNTVLKMAIKRAHIDGTIRALAASDIFTQDIEPPEGGEASEGGKPASKPAGKVTFASVMELVNTAVPQKERPGWVKRAAQVKNDAKALGALVDEISKTYDGKAPADAPAEAQRPQEEGFQDGEEIPVAFSDVVRLVNSKVPPADRPKLMAEANSKKDDPGALTELIAKITMTYEGQEAPQ